MCRPSCRPSTLRRMKFLPVAPHTRVTFPVKGDLITVTKAGISPKDPDVIRACQKHPHLKSTAKQPRAPRKPKAQQPESVTDEPKE